MPPKSGFELARTGRRVYPVYSDEIQGREGPMAAEIGRSDGDHVVDVCCFFELRAQSNKKFLATLYLASPLGRKRILLASTIAQIDCLIYYLHLVVTGKLPIEKKTFPGHKFSRKLKAFGNPQR